MSKRVSKRTPANLEVRFSCCNTFYSGTVRNFSEKGMYIDSEICFPMGSRFVVLLKMKDDILKVPVKIVRTVKSGNTFGGMGVKLLNLPKEYSELLIEHNLVSLS